MKSIILFLVFLFVICVPAFAQYTGTGSNTKTTKVKTYVKKDGTIVKEHRRTQTNSYNLDNFKAKNNYNPYTGKVGTTTYKSPNNSLYKPTSKSSYKSTLPAVKSNNSYKIKSYTPKKIRIK